MYDIFIAEGDKVCTELLKTPKYRIDSVFIVQDTLHKYEILLEGLKEKTEIISSREMEQISALKTTSDILLLLEVKEDNDNVLLKKGTSAIYLDGVQDPGNVGTLDLITADYSKILRSGKTLYGTFMDGVDINAVIIESDAILVMGSEGKGISTELEKSIRNKIAINGSRSKIAESLNVSVAAGIICERWKGGVYR